MKDDKLMVLEKEGFTYIHDNDISVSESIVLKDDNGSRHRWGMENSPASMPFVSPAVKKRRIVLLGATGSVGESVLRVVRSHRDRLELVGVAACRSKERLDVIAHEFDIAETVLFNHEGIAGLERLATLPDADIVIVATTGTVALRPVLAALAAGKDVALANKETLVAGGHLVMAAASISRGRVYPLDSEHNAIFQCLEGNSRHGNIRRLLLTSSGGALRDTPVEKLDGISVEEVLKHPNWSMGPKITVDSATMANKGLEIIEAHWLFGVQPEQIDVVIHPQSIVHSMVEFLDNSILAQMSPPSMTFAIQHVLLYPERSNGVHEALDFSKMLTLDFRPPDENRYPCLGLARKSLIGGGMFPLVYNAANEVAVEAFLSKQISFSAIPHIIADALEMNNQSDLPDNLEDLIEADAFAHARASVILRKYLL